MPLSYKKQKPTKDFDCIIVGSGMSGMGLAGILAKEGWKCLVLERHYTPGGYTHVFKRRKYEWDVGVHYIGEVHKEYTPLFRMFNYLSEGRLKWAEMDDNYDRIIFGEESFDLMAGRENLIEKLVEYFPEERGAIEQYVTMVREASKSARDYFAEKVVPKMVAKLTGNRMRKGALKFAEKTTKEVLEGLTQNKKLIAVLTGQYGDYGLPPGESSFLMHAMLVNHYFKGGAFPVGGSAQIFDTIEPTIEAAGGEVYTNAEVSEILVEKGKAVGVKMLDGTEIRAKYTISSIGADLTFGKLMKDEKSVSKYREAVEDITLSTGHLCLYVGLNADNTVLKLPKTNYWVFPDGQYDHDEAHRIYRNDPENAPLPLVYISFPSAKDPSWKDRYPGRSTVELITITDYEFFKKWDGTNWKKRGEEYDAYKEKLSQKLLKHLFKYCPQTEAYLDEYELSTPLSTKHFVNYSKGELYGLNHTPNRFKTKSLRAATPIKNLYITGQDLVTVGIGGALISSFLTASAMLGKNMMKKILS